LKPPVLKTGVHFVDREFESRPLRHQEEARPSKSSEMSLEVLERLSKEVGRDERTGSMADLARV
jgi:hypothetical protein